MPKTHKTSAPQFLYMVAAAAFEADRKAHQDYSKLMDAECERLGIATPYGILPDGHPMWAEAQKLLEAENASRKRMMAAAHELFDWALSETFKRCGTEKQKTDIRAAVAKVKQMAFVEKPFRELVDISLRLRAA